MSVHRKVCVVLPWSGGCTLSLQKMLGFPFEKVAVQGLQSWCCNPNQREEPANDPQLNAGVSCMDYEKLPSRTDTIGMMYRLVRIYPEGCSLGILDYLYQG